VEIGGRPILWHIMKGFAHHGFNEFVIALGYRGEVIKRYFLDYSRTSADLTVCIGTGQVRVHERAHDDWTIHLVDTGQDTITGGRIKRVSAWLGNETFML